MTDEPGTPPDGVALAACRSSHVTMQARIESLGDDAMRAPSLLPDWTVGHVVTHLARNAEGMLRMVEGARRGEVAEMYPGGRERRAADIEAGAARSAADIVADAIESARRLDDAFAALAPEQWNGAGRMVTGEVPIRQLPAGRRGEVEIHLRDLGRGYDFGDMPADFVRAELTNLTNRWASRRPMGMTQLPAAALALDPAQRLAWITGRLVLDGVEPARVYG